ncbi:MAG: hypothetical protein JST26_00365 [Bacteroidetes bacterium]|nr:hypothetical protein [Bacteroidota bacterium]
MTILFLFLRPFRMGTFAFLFLFFFNLLPQKHRAQCQAFPVFSGCTPPSGVLLADGDNITGSLIKTFSGTASYNSITLNGGQLLVCGNLTLTDISVISGTITIAPGATLTVMGGGALVFGANTTIYNYGNLSFRRSVVTGSSNTIINCLTSSVFSVPFDQFIVQGPNSYFVNNGQSSFSYFIIQSTNSAGCVCQGPGSMITTSILINQYTNSFVLPTGVACVNVLNQVINSNAVSANTKTLICLPGSINVIVGPNWGAATVFNSCNGCLIVLPVELLSFRGTLLNDNALLTWSTLSEKNNCRFVAEHSTDAIHFDSIAGQIGAINSTEFHTYSVLQPHVRKNILHYYRLRLVDCDGTFTYSRIIELDDSWQGDQIQCFPNPTQDYVYIAGNKMPLSGWILYNSHGEELTHIDTDSPVADMRGFPMGLYYLEIILSNGEVVTRKIQKTE